MDIVIQEHFLTITKTYYKGVHGIILTYDVTKQNWFTNIKYIKQIEANTQMSVKKVLVRNKYDKYNWIITEEEGKKLADDYSINFFEIPGKTNQNANEVFNYSRKSNDLNSGNNSQKLVHNNSKRKKKDVANK